MVQSSHLQGLRLNHSIYLYLITGLLILSITPAFSQAVTAQAGKFSVAVTTTPPPPIAGENTFTFSITSEGQPATGLTVDVNIDMVGMPMPANFKAQAGALAGEYIAQVNLSMEGKWKINVAITQMTGMEMAGDGVAQFMVETGKSITASGGGASSSRLWLFIISGIILIILLITGFIFRRKITGNIRGVIAGILTLVIVFIITWAVVHKYRDPKMSTLLASAQMDMSTMQAPAGTVPVVVEVVKDITLQPSVKYTGTVLADLEEEVYPRVTGKLVYMPFYPGDEIQKGTLIAKLDTSELAAKTAQAAHGREKAAQEINVAHREAQAGSAEYTRALREVDQARTGVAQMQAELKNAQAGIRAAEADVVEIQQKINEATSMQRAATAGIDAANEKLADTRAQLDSSEAEVTFQRLDLGRKQQLLKAGAISQSELDRGTAEAKVAEAEVKRSEAGIRAASAELRQSQEEATQAKARIEMAKAQYSASKIRVSQAQAQRDAVVEKLAESKAAVATASAGAKAMQAQLNAKTSRISVANAEQRQARAMLTEAQTVQGYTEIKAANSGVVTARLISPGVLVQPGMAILRLAKLDNVRLQASISQKDALKLQVGQIVSAYLPGDIKPAVEGALTQIFPTADPASRTMIIEARVLNPARALKPGQSITLQISESIPGSTGINVPNQALVSRDGETSIFIAQQEQGRFVARKIKVQIKTLDGERSQVISGLKSGAQVVISGYENLHDGDSVKITRVVIN